MQTQTNNFDLVCPPKPPPIPYMVSKPDDVIDILKETISPVHSYDFDADLKANELIHHFLENNPLHDDHLFISFNRQVRTLIQKGPMCGLTALAMAGSNLCLTNSFTVADLFEYSKKSKYSRQGEMFSAYHLADVATHCLKVSSEVIDVFMCDIHCFVLHNLMMGNLFLIPYDVDKDHTPCLKNGHKAHWGLITGFLFKVSTLNGLHGDFSPLKTHQNVYYLKKAITTPLILQKVLRNNIFLFVRHGKSKNLSLWSLESLLESNINLKEVDPDKHCDTEMWEIPKEGINNVLGGKVVLLKNTVENSLQN